MNQDKKENTASERIIKTTKDIDSLEKTINNVLNKNKNICKYWKNINDHIWGVSFKVDENQYLAMIQTSFEISISINEIEGNSVHFSKEIEECDQWSPLYEQFVSKLC